MTKALDRQAGGRHYKEMEIQPIEFCQRNRLDFCESAVIKYVCRHRAKGGAEDIKKAIHMLECLLELDYGAEQSPPCAHPHTRMLNGQRICLGCGRDIM